MSDENLHRDGDTVHEETTTTTTETTVADHGNGVAPETALENDQGSGTTAPDAPNAAEETTTGPLEGSTTAPEGTTTGREGDTIPDGSSEAPILHPAATGPSPVEGPAVQPHQRPGAEEVA